VTSYQVLDAVQSPRFIEQQLDMVKSINLYQRDLWSKGINGWIGKTLKQNHVPANKAKLILSEFKNKLDALDQAEQSDPNWLQASSRVGTNDHLIKQNQLEFELLGILLEHQVENHEEISKNFHNVYEDFGLALILPAAVPKTTPIKLVQTKIDVPKYGPSILEPRISKIITTAPHKKTMSSRT
jgi:hypothetical protein